MTESRSTFFPPVRDRAAATSAGFRFGHVGTHSSRTMMLDELEALLSATPVDAQPDQHANAVIEENCLGKQTVQTAGTPFSTSVNFTGSTPTCRCSAFSCAMAVRFCWQTAPRLLAALARDPLLRHPRRPP